MTKLLTIFLSAILSLNVFAVEAPKEDAKEAPKAETKAEPKSYSKDEVAQVQDLAKEYKGELDDLSDLGKSAVVSGDMTAALAAFETALSATKQDSKNVDQETNAIIGVSINYQLFLLYTDPTNKNRDTAKAKTYLDALTKNWPRDGKTAKAKELHKKYNLK